MRARFEQALGEARLDLTPAEARTLVAAQRRGPVRQAELALALGIEPMTLVNHLDRLESRSMVRREAAPLDRRSKQVIVTTTAKPAIRRIRRVLDQATASALASFSAQERSQFADFLERLCHALHPDMARSAVDTPD